ncbi:MAG: DNA topoisomerase IV, partial [Planctomycetota bacterium]
KILLLFDPDADGIHCGALMLIFLHRVFPQLIEAGMIEIVRAPLVCFDLKRADEPTASKTLYAYLDEQASKLRSELDCEGFEYNQRRFRGLASMDRDTLVQTCIDPESRGAQLVTAADTTAALAVFGGTRSSSAGSRP